MSIFVSCVTKTPPGNQLIKDEELGEGQIHIDNFALSEAIGSLCRRRNY